MYVPPGKRRVTNWKIYDWDDEDGEILGEYIVGYDTVLKGVLRSTLIKQFLYTDGKLVGAKTMSGSEYEFIENEDDL